MSLIEVLTKEEIRNLLKEVWVEELSKRKNSSHSLSNKILDRKGAAKLLGISLPTLDQYTREGTIPSKRIGKKILYEQDEVLKCGRDMISMRHKRSGNSYSSASINNYNCQ
jgi:excisionase family DNA binding protein